MSESPYAAARLYRHSGKVPASAALIALLVSCLAAAILGSVYGGAEFLAQMIPYAKASFIAVIVVVIFFGISLGAVAAYLLAKFNARSTPAAIGLAVISTFVGYYFSWITWLACALIYTKDQTPFTALINPSNVYEFIRIVKDSGFFPLIDFTPKGTFLLVMWVIELLTILAAAWTTAASRMNAKVFCESCQTWGTTRPLMKIKDPGNTAQLKSTLASGNLTPLTSAAPYSSVNPSWLDVSLEGCSTCDNLQTLSVTHINILKTKNGSTTKKSNILKRLLLTPDQTVSLAVAAAGLTNPLPVTSPETPPAPSSPT